MKTILKIFLVLTMFSIGCVGLTSNLNDHPVLDPQVTHPAELQKEWDKLYPTIITNDIYNVWKDIRADKTYPQPRWAKIPLREATQLIVHLCDAYNIKYPDQIVKDEAYLKAQDTKYNQGYSDLIIGAQTHIANSDGKVTIYFRYDEVFLSTVFHEFYHVLDYRKNGYFKITTDKNKICNFSGNKFWNKYVARLFEYEKKMKASNQF